MTFSIVAYDAATQSLGVAVASKFLAVGAVVPFAQAGAGAIATQALANLRYGPDGLAMLGAGRSATEVVQMLTDADDGRDERQLGIVDAQGNAATYTGRKCMDWAGGVTGPGYAAQGNILAGAAVVQAMAVAYERASGEFATRLLAALKAGDDAGGDRRGKQAAALLIVRAGSGYGGGSDRWLDLRADDHPDPVAELSRLLRLHDLYFGKTEPKDKLKLDASMIALLQDLAKRSGQYHGETNGALDDVARAALNDYIGVENLEERVDLTHGTIDPPALAYLEAKLDS
jgi:uncharacterized Ntn-hydrolase superfamily protein